MRYLAFAVLALACSVRADALNLRATTRADHKSLQLLCERLERLEASLDEGSWQRRFVVACLDHARPMRDRRGGPIPGAVELGSEEEAELIAAQHGYAHTSANLSEIREEIRDTVLGWLWNRIWAILLGCIPWVPLVMFLLWNRSRLKRLWRGEEQRARMSDEEQVALRRLIDRAIPDREERKTKLAGDPVADRGHARLKSEGKL